MLTKPKHSFEHVEQINNQINPTRLYTNCVFFPLQFIA